MQRIAELVDLEKCFQYLVAKFGFDTEENEPLKVWGVIQIIRIESPHQFMILLEASAESPMRDFCPTGEAVYRGSCN